MPQTRFFQRQKSSYFRSLQSLARKKQRWQSGNHACDVLEDRILLAAVFWDAGGDGVSWSDSLNWNKGGLDEVPAPGDDVTINDPADPLINIASAVSINSLTSSDDIHVSAGSLTLLAASQINADFLMTSGTSLTVSGAGASLSVTGLVDADGATLQASGGGQISLPGLTTYQNDRNADVFIQATGAGSSIALPNLASITGRSDFADDLFIQASGGAQIDIGSLASAVFVPSGSVTFRAEDALSQIDLTNLTHFQGYLNSTSSGFFAQTGGTLITPNLVDVRAAHLQVDATGAMNTSQIVTYDAGGGTMSLANSANNFTNLTSLKNADVTLTYAPNFSNVTSLAGSTLNLDAVSPSFPSVTDIDNSQWILTNGAQVTLSGVTSYTNTFTNDDDRNISATGTGSRFSLPNITTITGQQNFRDDVLFDALQGGVIELGTMVTALTVPSGAVRFQADGTGSQIDLTNLTHFQGYFSDTNSGFIATNAGSLVTPNLTNVHTAHLTLDSATGMNTSQIVNFEAGGGTFSIAGIVVDFTNAVSLTNAIVNLSSVAPLLPNVQSVAGSTFNIDGVTPTFPSVTNIDNSQWILTNGAQVTLSGVTSYTNTFTNDDDRNISATGTGSRFSLPNITTITGQQNFRDDVLFDALQGGVIELGTMVPSLSVPSGAVRFQADGIGSQIDLTNLTNYQGYFSDTNSGFIATNSGSLVTPNLTNIHTAHLTLDSATGMNTSQIVNFDAGGGTFSIAGVVVDFTNAVSLTNAIVNLSSVAPLLPNVQSVAGSTFNIDGVTPTFPSVTNIDNSQWILTNGAQVTLSGVTSYTNTFTNDDDRNISVTGTGSRFSLPNITTITGQQNFRDDILFDALQGGVIELGTMVTALTVPSGAVRFQADGTGSQIDLTNLTHFQGYFSQTNTGFIATNGGTLVTPNLATVNTAHLTLDSATGMNTSQLVSYHAGGGTLNIAGAAADFTNLTTMTDANLTLDGVAYSFPSLTTLTASSLTVANGATASFLSLGNINRTSINISSGTTIAMPSVATFRHASTATSQDVSWQVSGTGSRLDLPNLESIIGATSYDADLAITASSGGAIDLSGVTYIVDPIQWDYRFRHIAITSTGTGSTIDLSNLAAFHDEPAVLYGDGEFSAFTTSGGGTITASTGSIDFLGVNVTLGAPMIVEGGNSILADDCASVPNHSEQETDPIDDAVESGPEVGTTATWIAGSGDWNTAANWSTGAVPGQYDDVVIDDPGQALTVTISSGNVVVKSLNSNEAIVVSGGSLSVTNASQINNALALAPLTYLQAIGPNASMTVTGTATADSASLYASQGGEIHLPGMTSYQNTNTNDVDQFLRASGPGSLLSLPNVISITGPQNFRDEVFVQAQQGGIVQIGANVMALTVPSGAVTFQADGSGSQIDVPNLTSFQGYFNSTNSGFSATNGGSLITPNLTDITTAHLTLDAVSSMNTAQIVNLNAGNGTLSIQGVAVDFTGLQTLTNAIVYLDGVAPTWPNLTTLTNSTFFIHGVSPLFANVTNIDSTQWLLTGGAQITLSGVTSYTNTFTNDDDRDIRVTGTGSRFSLPNVTTITGQQNFRDDILFDALQGGVIELGTMVAALTVPSGAVRFQADGTGSQIDLTNLTSYQGYFNSTDSGFIATNGGSLITPNLTDITTAHLTLDSTGSMNTAQIVNFNAGGGTLSIAGIPVDFTGLQTLTNAIVYLDGVVPTWPNLTTLTNSTFYIHNVTPTLNNVIDIDSTQWLLSGGAQVSLPAVTSYTNTFTNDDDRDIRVTGAGSRFSLPNITTITGQQNFRDDILFDALHGGVIELGTMVPALTVPSGAVRFNANGAGSQIDLTNLTTYQGYFNSTNSGFIATAGGSLITPNLTDITTAHLTLDATGSMDTAQIVNFNAGNGTLSIEGVAVDFTGLQTLTNAIVYLDGVVPTWPNLTTLTNSTFFIHNVSPAFANVANIDSTQWLLSGGAQVTLSGVTSYTNTFTNDDDRDIRVTGAGSRFSLPNIDTITGQQNFGDDILFDALQGGVIELGTMVAALTVPSGAVRFQADGTGSQIDLTNLTSFQGYLNATDPGFVTGQGGTLLVPNLATIGTANIRTDHTSSVTFSALTTASSAFLSAAGGTISTPLLASLTHGSVTLTDGGSVNLTSVTDLSSTSLYAYDGITISLPGVINFTHASTANSQDVTWLAYGPGSLIDLPNLDSITGGTHYDTDVFAQAYYGGEVSIPQMQSIVDPNSGDLRRRSVHFLADGVGSEISLDGLASFLDRNATGTLDGERSVLHARHGGAIHTLLGATSFTGVDVIADRLGTITGDLTFADDSQLRGAGTIDGSVDNVSGTVMAGLSPGVLSLTGNYTNRVDGRFVAEIGGAVGSGENDLLDVAGNVTLEGGTIQIGRLNSYLPAVSDQFTVITGLTRTGQFDVAEGIAIGDAIKLEPDYTPSEVLLVAAVDAGPKVIHVTPSGTVDSTIQTIDVTFDEPVDPASFTAVDITLTGPNGPVTVVGFTTVSDTVISVDVDDQITPGMYSLSIGPDITDTAMNPMDQDGDTVNGEPVDDVFTSNFTLTANEDAVLIVNVNGSYNAQGQQIFDTVVAAGARALFVHLDVDGEVNTALQADTYDQIWVFDLSTGADAYPTDWQAIVNWYNADTSRDIVADARMISSYWSNRYLTEGALLSENYYENLKTNGGLVLGTDHDAFQGGINTINAGIGLDLFSGNFSQTKIPVDTANPLMTTPNNLGIELWDDSSPGLAPFGLQSGGQILYTVAWHGGNFATPGISSTIPGAIGLSVGITSPTNGAQFLEGANVHFAAQQQNGVLPVTYTWSSDLDGALGTGQTLDVTTLSLGTHVITLLGVDSVNAADSEQITITIVAVNPTVALDLQSGSDSGVSNTDNITNDNTPTYDITVNQSGTIFVDFDGDNVDDFTQAVTAGTVPVTSTLLADNTYLAKVTFDNGSSQVVDTLSVTIDTQAPTLLAGAASEQAPLNARELVFSETIDLTSLQNANPALMGPGGPITINSITGSGDTYSVNFDWQITPGAYTFSTDPSVIDVAGNAIAALSDPFTLLADMTAPVVASFAPLGPVDADVTLLTVQFSEPINGATFTTADLVINGPGGPVNVSGYMISQTDDFTFSITATGLTLEGDYDITVGPAIEDLSANTMSAAYVGAFTIDKTGPSVISVAPTGMVNDIVDHLDITFDSPINSASFTAADVQLTDPNSTPIGVSNPIHVSGNTYRITFAPQRINGIYNMTIGPNITDPAGNDMTVNAAGAHADSFTVSLPDLVIVDPITLGSGTATFGGPLTVDWTVRNDGTAPANDGWTDRVYLSTDNVLSGDDTLLKDVLVTGFGQLAPAATQPLNTTVVLPLSQNLTPGTYYIIVNSDDGGQRDEADEGNNTRAAQVTLGLPPLPDLIVDPNLIVAPATLTPGATFPISWTVQNSGTADASGTWQERVYVSDTALGTNRTLLGSFSRSGTLAPTDPALMRSETLTLPVHGFSGPVYFLVEVDAADNIFELDENNLFASTATSNIESVLTMNLSGATLTEEGGPIQATLTRNGNPAAPLVVTLSATNAGRVNVPAQVTIPAGQFSTTFDVSAVDDMLVNGDVPVQLTAQATGFPDAVGFLQVVDNDQAALMLMISPNSLAEGGQATATISTSVVPTSNILVTLTADRSQLDLPTAVTIPMGQSSAQFTITAIDDALVELDALYTIDATAFGQAAASADVTVTQSDLPNLTLTLPASELAEGADGPTVQGTVTRDVVTDQPLTVALSASVMGELSLPASVTIPADQASGSFLFSVNDDALVNGSRVVNVTAQTIPSGGGNPITTGSDTQPLTILDNDGPTLTVTIDQDKLKEGTDGTATITRNTNTTNALPITLMSSDGTELSVMMNAEIPAGSASVQVVISALDDAMVDGDQTVSVTATATGFNSGTDTVIVSDVQLPDLEVTSLSAPATGLTGESIDVSWTVLNSGFATANGTWIQRVFISDDNQIGGDTLAGQFAFSGPLPLGQSYNRTVPIQLPSTPGSYYVILELDATNALTEGLETNNFAIVSTATVVDPAYSATVSTSVTTAPADTPVPLTGTATRPNSDPAAFESVAIHLNVQGTTRLLFARTDASGNFQTTFTPLPGEGGQYTIGAAHPGVPTAPVQDSFQLVGMRSEPASDSVRLIEAAAPIASQTTIRNLADLPLTGLSVSTANVPANLNVTAGLAGAVTTLAALGTVALDFTAEALDASTTSGTFEILISSNEAPTITIPITYEVVPLLARLSANPGSLDAEMLVGSQTSVEFTVTNVGGAATDPLTIELPPGADWLALATPANLPALNPGESTRVTLLLTPPSDLPLTIYSGGLLVTGGDSWVEVPFSFRAITGDVGGVQVTVVDEFFYFDEAQPLVSGARVALIDALTSEEIASSDEATMSSAGESAIEATPSVTIDPQGRVSFNDFPEGPYIVEVRSDDHETSRQNVNLTPGSMLSEQIFISRSLVEYTWTVEEVQLEDRTKITIDAVFETNVPAPVVTVEVLDQFLQPAGAVDVSPLNGPNVQVGDTIQYNIKLKNHGLIAAQDVAFDVGTHPYYKITPLISEVGVLPAKSELIIPVTVTRIALPTEAELNGNFQTGTGLEVLGIYNLGGVGSGELLTDLDGETEADVPCHIPLGVEWSYICGLPVPRFTNVPVPNVQGDCPAGRGTAVGGGGGGGTGGRVRGVSSPTVVRATECPDCLGPTILLCALSATGPLGSLLACAYGVADSVTNLTFGMGDAGSVGANIAGCLVPPAVGCVIGLLDCLRTSQGQSEGFSEATIDPDLIPPWGDEFVAFWDAVDAYHNAVYGAGWFSEFTAENEAAWRTRFGVAIDAGSESGASLSPAERADLTSGVLPEGVDADRVNQYLDRWQRSVDYWAQNIFTVADVPQGMSTDFIAQDVLSAASTSLDTTWQALDAFNLFTGSMVANTDELVQAGLLPEGSAEAAENGVCAQVRIRIEQEAVQTRQGFEAMLGVINPPENPASLENLRAQIFITDANGKPANHLFVVQPQFTAPVDGFTVTPGQTQDLKWIIVPTDEAAPTDTTTYFVGGRFTYIEDSIPRFVELADDAINVDPQPELHLDYFLQRDVYSDDPFTPETEPAIPFTLGVIVQNDGAGEATNLSIESAQPEIIENEKGLLIDFQIIGTAVNGSAVERSLTAQIGNLAPGALAIAEWQLESSLQGLFVDYDASFEHVTNFGSTQLSLIKSVEIHELIRKVDAAQLSNDGLPDFLVNDLADPADLPDTLYLSDGSIVGVGLGANAMTDAPPTIADLQVQLTATMDPAGWSYVKFDDPSNGDFELIGVERSDNTFIPVDNFWQTDRTFIGQGQRPTQEDKIHLLDLASTGTYTLYFSNGDLDGPEVVSFAGVNPNPTNVPIDTIDVEFDELLLAGSFDPVDLTLLKNGAPVALSGVSVGFLSGTTYQVSGLSSFTADDAVYELQVDLTGLTDVVANPGIGSESFTWVKGAAAPAIISLDGAPFGVTNVAPVSIDAVFTEPLMGLPIAALTLTRDAGPNLIDGTVQITQVSSATYRVTFPAGMADVDGDYVFQVDATQVMDLDSNAGIGARSESWTLDTVAPLLDQIFDVPTDPRNIVVQQIDVEFSEPIDLATFDVGDLTLTRAGDAGQTNLVANDSRVMFEHRSGNVYRVSGINWNQAFVAMPQIDDFTFVVDMAGIADPAGNLGTGTMSTTWTIDLDAPLPASNFALATFTGPVVNGMINSRNATITGDLNNTGDPGGLFRMVAIHDMVTGQELARESFTGATFSLPITFPTSGQARLRVRTIDDAGNVADAFINNLFVEDAPPVVEAVTGLPGAFTNLAFDSFDVTFVDPINPATFTATALTLTHNSTPLNTAGVTLTLQPDGRTYRFAGLLALTGVEGEFDLQLDLSGVENQMGVGSTEGTLSFDWLNDQVAPTSTITPLAPTQPLQTFEVLLSAPDPDIAPNLAGSGLASIDVYVSDNGGGFFPFITVPGTATSLTFTGLPGHTYDFQTIARDEAGNVETKPANQIDATTMVSAPSVSIPVTQVDSVDSSSPILTVNFSGTDADNDLAFFDVFVSVDGGAVQQIGHIPAGVPDGSNVYHGNLTYGAIADGTSHTYRFYSVGIDVVLNQEMPPASNEDVEVTLSFAPPVITGLGSARVYREDQPPALLAHNALVTDPDTTIFDGGQLIVSLLNGEQGDQLTVIDFRDVTTIGTDVRYLGTSVATISSNTGGPSGVMMIDFNANATLPAVTAVLNAVAFENSSDNPLPGVRGIRFTISDGQGSASIPVTQQITVFAKSDRPVIANLGGPVTFIEDGGPITLTTSGTLTDPDMHTDWNGAKLNVRISRNTDSFDRLTIRSDGDGAGQIRVTGSDVFYEGMQIGTWNGGVGTNRLQINFIAGSSTAAIQALIRAIQFENLIALPVVASKDIRFEITDPENFANIAIPDGLLIVNMQATNDLPSLSGINNPVYTYNEGGPVRTIGTGGIVTDDDYNGTGFLRVTIASGGEISDRLRVLHQGDGPNQIGVTSNQLRYSGVLIGMISGGVGTNPLQINFNSNAPRAGVEAAMRVIQYFNVSDNPSTTQRQFDFLFNDGDGADSNVVTAFVNVNATNDPSVIANFGADVNTTTNTNVRVASLVIITDVDSPHFAGGLFRATISSGQQAGDTLSLFNDATISTVGSDVFYLGTNIGTLVTNATSLTVLLNTNATATMVQRLGRNLEFSATAAGTRTLRYQVLDGNGGNTTGPDKNLVVV